MFLKSEASWDDMDRFDLRYTKESNYAEDDQY